MNDLIRKDKKLRACRSLCHLAFLQKMHLSCHPFQTNKKIVDAIFQINVALKAKSLC